MPGWATPSCHASCCRQCSMHGWHDVCQSPASLVIADWTENWCLTQRLWYSGCPIVNETGWCKSSAQRGHCILDDDWPIKQSLFYTIWIWDPLGVLSRKAGQKWADPQRGVRTAWLQAVGATTQQEQWRRERNTARLWPPGRRKQTQSAAESPYWQSNSEGAADAAAEATSRKTGGWRYTMSWVTSAAPPGSC